jgi:hypothetical protein
MNVHERSIQLAAGSLTELLSAADQRGMEDHLGVCPACRGEHARLASDHRRLRELIAPRPVPAYVRATVLAEVATGKRTSLWQVLLIAALLALLIAGIAAMAGRSPLPDALTGFSGRWTSTNCAMWEGSDAVIPTIDCDRWGDGTGLILEIGQGETREISISGSSAPACGGTGIPDLDAVGPGGTFLWVMFDRTDCGDIGPGPDLGASFYLEPDGRRIWLDDDGDDWGMFWSRVP